MVLYYGGHARGRTWHANRHKSSGAVNWQKVQGYVFGSSADVLVILDTSSFASTVKTDGPGDNWLLEASGKRGAAKEESGNSFTSALIRFLERKGHIFWTEGKIFTVQDIHKALIMEEDSLRVTLFLVKLTEDECQPTELTPLQKDEPNTGPPQDLHSPIVHEVLETLSDSESHTVRLSGLPSLVRSEDIVHWLGSRLGSDAQILRVGPITSSFTSTATVTLSSAVAAMQALLIGDKYFQFQGETEKIPITVENHFLGPTCLYSAAGSSANVPFVDIVFVHGAYGHAISSFASYQGNPPKEKLWICDELPKALGLSGIATRILTLAWNANSWLNPHESVFSGSENLLKELRRERSGIPKRPIVFVGHGVGGLLVKQAVNEIVNSGFGDEGFENPVVSCFFFAVPHRSGYFDFAFILATMQATLGKDNPSKSALALALRPRNRQILRLSTEFSNICKEHRISTVCFFEEHMTYGDFVVPKDSAILDEAYGIDANYRDVIRLADSERNIKGVLMAMRKTILAKTDPSRLFEGMTISGQRLKPDAWPTQAYDRELIYSRLNRYDTLFLVDDSSSMHGPRWRTASHLTAALTSIIIKYDVDGIGIRFFKNHVEGMKHVKSSERVLNLFSRIEPDGLTFTADVLEEVLNEYMFEYRTNRRQKGLKVIILTDGEPEQGQDVEAVIVKYAQKLEAMNAKPFHVGLQFVQIGGDEGAARFLTSLNDLQKKYKLDRDVCIVSHRHVQN